MDERLKKVEEKAKAAQGRTKAATEERVEQLKTKEKAARTSVKKSFDKLKTR